MVPLGWANIAGAFYRASGIDTGSRARSTFLKQHPRASVGVNIFFTWFLFRRRHSACCSSQNGKPNFVLPNRSLYIFGMLAIFQRRSQGLFDDSIRPWERGRQSLCFLWSLILFNIFNIEAREGVWRGNLFDFFELLTISRGLLRFPPRLDSVLYFYAVRRLR